MKRRCTRARGAEVYAWAAAWALVAASASAQQDQDPGSEVDETGDAGAGDDAGANRDESAEDAGKTSPSEQDPNAHRDGQKPNDQEPPDSESARQPASERSAAAPSAGEEGSRGPAESEDGGEVPVTGPGARAGSSRVEPASSAAGTDAPAGRASSSSATPAGSRDASAATGAAPGSEPRRAGVAFEKPTSHGAAGDLEQAPATAAPLPPLQRYLALEANGGVSVRLDGEGPDFDTEEPVDMAFGAGLWLAPARWVSLGVAYQRTGLGGVRSQDVRQDTISAQRDLDTVWAGARGYPYRTESWGVFGELQMGGSWQHVTATGTRSTDDFVQPAEVFSCSGAAGPSLAAAVSAGVDVDLDRQLGLLARIGGAHHFLSSSSLDSCAPGAGEVSNVAARLGFQYRFDLER